ncbi:hypothetical protein [Actinopolyspora mortivallis]|uniref:DUF8083 domain-containing protein n=1 Tax=Actinopolyspora mortivallis TaxID=33906 RepID=A0A2T0GTR4_ACTMO|nr:hypothetical protein [Actinopolyspora mortivallis]PRW62484.1 hypothetical protein CEP50_15205 [Actinopolyspora mortivallis]
MPEPFVAYMRVYEPLSSFESPRYEQLSEALDQGAVDPVGVGAREQHRWLRSQLSVRPRLLPGEGVDGTAREREEVLVLHPEDVPAEAEEPVGPGPLVCPLDLRGRAAAALVGFLGAADPPLRAAALPMPAETAKSKASAVVNELSSSAVHVISSTWTVPLPWFAVVDPEQRVVTHDERGNVERVYWRTPMSEARRRVSRAHTVTRNTLGEEGPPKILRETGRWLERFHPHSAVELDYGGLVRMMSDEDLLADSSAADVHSIVDAMELGHTTEVGERYEALRDFWAEMAAHERYN